MKKFILLLQEKIEKAGKRSAPLRGKGSVVFPRPPLPGRNAEEQILLLLISTVEAKLSGRRSGPFRDNTPDRPGSVPRLSGGSGPVPMSEHDPVNRAEDQLKKEGDQKNHPSVRVDALRPMRCDIFPRIVQQRRHQDHNPHADAGHAEAADPEKKNPAHRGCIGRNGFVLKLITH